MKDWTAPEIEAILENEQIYWGTDATGDEVDNYEFYYELPYHKKAYLEKLGVLTYVEHAPYKEHVLYLESNGATWLVMLVFQTEDGRYFRKQGEDDSWDGKGFYLPLEEVEQVEEVVKVWEVKHDY